MCPLCADKWQTLHYKIKVIDLAYIIKIKVAFGSQNEHSGYKSIK